MYRTGTSTTESGFLMRYYRAGIPEVLPWIDLGSTQVLGEYHSSSGLILPSMIEVAATGKWGDFFRPDENQPKHASLEALVEAGRTIWGLMLENTGVSDVLTHFTTAYQRQGDQTILLEERQLRPGESFRRPHPADILANAAEIRAIQHISGTIDINRPAMSH